MPQVAGVALAVAGCDIECHGDGSLIQNCPLPVPASFTVGDTRFEIKLGSANAPYRQLQKLCATDGKLRSHKSSRSGPSPTTLSRWFAALSSLNHWATSLQELYVQAARCAVEAIGLDGGMVLRRRDDHHDTDFSVTKLLAGIVQIISLAVLLLAYIQGRNNPQTYVLVALMLQTFTISLLIMGRQK